MMYPRGIDVSVNNGDIDWHKVHRDNCYFAMIKATQGHSVNGKHHYFEESKFKTNITEAYATGLKCGVYHYLTADSVEESIKEADLFINSITPYKAKISLWAAVDVEEDKYLPKDRTMLTKVVNSFCERVEKAGFKPMVYTNPNYLRFKLNDVSKWDLWLALWRDIKYIPKRSQYPNIKLWQYGAGKIDGIKDKCDVNLALSDLNLVVGKPQKPYNKYADIVCAKCGLEKQTRQYLDNYKYADYLWKKLYNQMI